MRLWHYKLIPFLPKSQLLSQWRELNSIFAKEDKNILINYIYEYSRNDLYNYTVLVINEMRRRNYRVNSFKYFQDYFLYDPSFDFYCEYDPFHKHHNNTYLLMCYYNLAEKHLRGQKDFDDETFYKLKDFVRNEITKSIEKENENDTGKSDSKCSLFLF